VDNKIFGLQLSFLRNLDVAKDGPYKRALTENVTRAPQDPDYGVEYWER
jgi:hypothetical protein